MTVPAGCYLPACKNAVKTKRATNAARCRLLNACICSLVTCYGISGEVIDLRI